ncbi:hypothetical protein BDK51DRAFT_52191 [Blyttiomyces helicus]|uniref:Uncharacterized protein n=1 Tax=Blyttiomyces helicus TaxID=388810 RepID=A0A4P9WAT9_9FUNG|nr:hypothetical protein BDK51DRAFT_52191 [Blyttiomyces helicus]|eukprot:RKO89721.1 hypothetical protein BDK51DRAFT_52191 [Blyttiomyces helicus]
MSADATIKTVLDRARHPHPTSARHVRVFPPLLATRTHSTTSISSNPPSMSSFVRTPLRVFTTTSCAPRLRSQFAASVVGNFRVLEWHSRRYKKTKSQATLQQEGSSPEELKDKFPENAGKEWVEQVASTSEAAVKADREPQVPIDELQTISVVRLHGEFSDAVEDLVKADTSSNRNNAEVDSEVQFETATSNEKSKRSKKKKVPSKRRQEGSGPEELKDKFPDNAGKEWVETLASASEAADGSPTHNDMDSSSRSDSNLVVAGPCEGVWRCWAKRKGDLLLHGCAGFAGRAEVGIGLNVDEGIDPRWDC